jgi:glucan phosphorylase
MDVAQGLKAAADRTATAAVAAKSLDTDLAALAVLARRLYREHLLRDQAADPARANTRARFAAFARAVRDLIAPRWVATQETYARLNPKQVYYLSMEFLIGRSLGRSRGSRLDLPA